MSMSAANRHFRTTLIPIEETISWKIHDVSQLRQTNSWTALAIPVEIGLGPTDLTRWSISLVRDANSNLCARATLVSPQDRRRVTHHLKVAVKTDDTPVYFFSNSTNSNNRTNHNSQECTPFLALRNLFNARLSFAGNLDKEIEEAQETSYEGDPTLWRVIPMSKIVTDEEDDMELIVTMTVFGCDVAEER